MPLYRLCWKLLISSRESCLVLQLQMPLCPCLDIIIKGKFKPKHQVLPAFNGIIMISIESRKSWCFGNLAPSLNFCRGVSGEQGLRHLSFALFVSINHFKISEDKKCNQLLFVVYFQIFIFHSQWLDLQVLMLSMYISIMQGWWN